MWNDDEIDWHMAKEPECPKGQCRDFWTDGDKIRCGWCGKVCGHRRG